MPFVSVTRLRLRSFRFLPAFVVATFASRAQLRRAEGFVAGALTLEPARAFWTISVWNSEASMRAFRNQGQHQRAMPKLLGWCDEASYTHWEQADDTLPTVSVAFEHLRTAGRLSKVQYPTAEHIAGRTTSSKPPLAGGTIRPITGS
jgi:hypothetical protein